MNITKKKNIEKNLTIEEYEKFESTTYTQIRTLVLVWIQLVNIALKNNQKFEPLTKKKIKISENPSESILRLRRRVATG